MEHVPDQLTPRSTTPTRRGLVLMPVIAPGDRSHQRLGGTTAVDFTTPSPGYCNTPKE